LANDDGEEEIENRRAREDPPTDVDMSDNGGRTKAAAGIVEEVARATAVVAICPAAARLHPRRAEAERLLVVMIPVFSVKSRCGS